VTVETFDDDKFEEINPEFFLKEDNAPEEQPDEQLDELSQQFIS
jgi:hypothetical protein